MANRLGLAAGKLTGKAAFQIIFKYIKIISKSSQNHLKSRLQMIGSGVGAGFYVSKLALQSVERCCMDL